MENYILLKDLPDAVKGTKVIWDEKSNAFYYDKGAWVSPQSKNYLTAGQVTQQPDFFCKESEPIPKGDLRDILQYLLFTCKREDLENDNYPGHAKATKILEKIKAL